MWPSLIPQGIKRGLNSAISVWSQQYLTDKTLFIALNFGALSHKSWHYHPATSSNGWLSLSDKQKLISLETECVKLINESIANPDLPVTDCLILSVLCMANNNSNNQALREPEDSPFRPSLQQLQWLQLYGRNSSNEVHRRGLAQLIQMRGGLQNIELPGLAAIISL